MAAPNGCMADAAGITELEVQRRVELAAREKDGKRWLSAMNHTAGGENLHGGFSLPDDLRQGKQETLKGYEVQILEKMSEVYWMNWKDAENLINTGFQHLS